MITEDRQVLYHEIEKLLQANSFTDQCNGISKIPDYLCCGAPNPDIVNIIYLKLSELFRRPQTNNYFRAILLTVIEQITPSTLKYVTTTQSLEFIRRVSHVLSSTDPTARTLTIRLLGIIAQISVDKTNVRHFIRQAIMSGERCSKIYFNLKYLS